MPSSITPSRLLLACCTLILSTAALAAPPKEVIASADAPKAIGPYSQAIKAGPMLFLTGQIPLDPATGKLVDGGIEAQTTRVLTNLQAVLAAGGMTTDNVVSTTVFVKDMADFGKVNAIYATFFKDKPPARATIQAVRLPLDALVEISAIAVQ